MVTEYMRSGQDIFPDSSGYFCPVCREGRFVFRDYCKRMVHSYIPAVMVNSLTTKTDLADVRSVSICDINGGKNQALVNIAYCKKFK